MTSSYLLTTPSSPSKSWAIMSCARDHTSVRRPTTHHERARGADGDSRLGWPDAERRRDAALEVMSAEEACARRRRGRRAR